jgi:phosphoglycerol transferase MdoB-like AlkP superfamily enzyme
MLKFILAIPLIMHGLANLSGVIAPWTNSLNGFQDAAWIFGGGVNYRSLTGRISSILWLLSTLMLVGAGIGVLTEQSWWVILAIIGAVASLLVILVWWKAVPPGARFGAFFDAGLLIVLVSPLQQQIMTALGG